MWTVLILTCRNHITLRSKKARRFEKMLNFDNSHSIVTSGSRVSRASPHQTLLAFLNLDGSINYWNFYYGLLLVFYSLNFISTINEFCCQYQQKVNWRVRVIMNRIALKIFDLENVLKIVLFATCRVWWSGEVKLSWFDSELWTRNPPLISPTLIIFEP